MAHGYASTGPWGASYNEIFVKVAEILPKLEAAYKEAGLMEDTEPGRRRILEHFLSFRQRYDPRIRTTMNEQEKKALREIRKLEDEILWACLEFRRKEMPYTY
jgi:hypothetical protein